MEFYVHQNCNMIYSIIDKRFKTINSNHAFKVLEGVKVSNNLIC